MDDNNRHDNELRDEVNRFNLLMINIGFMGENIMTWTEDDIREYHNDKMVVDSILQHLEHLFIHKKSQIIHLRTLLINKTENLYNLMALLEIRKNHETELANPFHVIEKQVVKGCNQPPKSKSFLGLFGKKNKENVNPTTIKYNINKALIAQQQAKYNAINADIDSILERNKLLNDSIKQYIDIVNRDIQVKLHCKEREIESTRKETYRDIGVLIAFVLLMLLISYGIIHRDLLQRERDRRRLEESIRQNNALLEMRKKIILTISHDIRGPLNVISGSAELAIDTRDKKKRDRYLNNARILCKHVVHLLNNLLDVYRLNEAKETPNNIPFRLNALLDRIALGAAQVINDKGLLFIHEFKGSDVTVRGDEDRIEQIADNILSNAVKFTQSGTVGFSASYTAGMLRMDFSDTGCGMSDETMERIFLPFERADNSDDIKGFGLGLSITKGLVSLLGGSIEVESKIRNGTVFHVCIPLPLAEESEVSETRDMPYPNSLRLPRNVIVIDDDPMQRNIVCEMLERNSVSCTVCATAQEVVKAMRGQDYDILLTDINMPGTSGFSLLELLRKSNIGNSRSIPVVAMTARDDDENKPLIKSGFSGCIFKPFSMQELLERISMIMEQSCNTKSDRFDFSRLLTGTSDRGAILHSLTDSTVKDMDALKKAADDGNRKAIRAIIHRMKPVWEMLGQSELLYSLENAAKDKASTKFDIKQLTEDVLMALENLLGNINDEMKEIRYEEQDTDC